MREGQKDRLTRFVWKRPDPSSQPDCKGRSTRGRLHGAVRQVRPIRRCGAAHRFAAGRTFPWQPTETSPPMAADFGPVRSRQNLPSRELDGGHARHSLCSCRKRVRVGSCRRGRIAFGRPLWRPLTNQTAHDCDGHGRSRSSSCHCMDSARGQGRLLLTLRASEASGSHDKQPPCWRDGASACVPVCELASAKAQEFAEWLADRPDVCTARWARAFPHRKKPRQREEAANCKGTRAAPLDRRNRRACSVAGKRAGAIPIAVCENGDRMSATRRAEPPGRLSAPSDHRKSFAHRPLAGFRSLPREGAIPSLLATPKNFP